MRTSAFRAALRPRTLPLRRPRHELLLVVLVCAAALSPVYIATAQDTSRLCLTRALLEGRVTVDPCIDGNIDQARYRGRVYSDKAPGMSVLALPATALVRLPTAYDWEFQGDARLWAVRVLSSGLAFVALLILIGRVAEGLAPGSGGFVLVAFGLGTLLGPLAATTFGHVTSAALAFGAFVLASREATALAGLAAGAAAVVEYQAAAVAVILAGYVALRGARPLFRYAAAAAIPLAGLAVYNWTAFDSPFRLSYRYVANKYSTEQATGFFGIRVPDPHGVYWVLVGDRGLLVTSPVLVAAVVGLALLWRRHRLEAVTCGTVALVFLVVNVGYFLPYGGTSPGPRFLVPAIPFVALGLGPAFTRWPRATAALAGVSVAATIVVMLTWARALDEPYRQTVWGELARLVVDGGDAQLVRHLARNVVSWAGVGRGGAAVLVGVLAAAAFVVAVRDGAPRARSAVAGAETAP